MCRPECVVKCICLALNDGFTLQKRICKKLKHLDGERHTRGVSCIEIAISCSMQPLHKSCSRSVNIKCLKSEASAHF